jgi:hypothetical protein
MILAGAVFLLMRLVTVRGEHRAMNRLLHEASYVVRIPEEEYREMMVRRWKQMPTREMLDLLVVLSIPLALLAGIAFLPGGLLNLERVGLVILAGLPVINAWQAIVEVMRVRRWARTTFR